MMSSTTKVNIGIDELSRVKIAEGLSRLLADTYSLYLKTHNFHEKFVGRIEFKEWGIIGNKNLYPIPYV